MSDHVREFAETLRAFKPSGDVDCTQCEGSGRVPDPNPNVHNKIRCACVIRRVRARLRGIRSIANWSPFDLEFEEPACPQCDDSGFYAVRLEIGDRAFGRAVPCPHPQSAIDARDRRLYHEEMTRFSVRANIPGRYREVRLRTFDPPNDERRRQVEAWMSTWQPRTPFLVLTGGYGTGKTHLGCATIYAARDRHGLERARFELVTDLLARIRDTFSQKSERAEGDIMRELTGYPLLVLDDLGAEKATDWAAQTLFRVINQRYNDEKPTVITTNLDQESIEPRVASRLVDSETSTLVYTGDTDYRTQRRTA